MASQSLLRAGVQSPARALMRPMASKSILKRPAPLPLSPSSFTANFSVVVSGSKASPHVHFAASPSMLATFTAHSANTYDRGPILTSPASADLSSWMGRMLSPTAYNAFKLTDPPKRTPFAKHSASLAPPPPVAVSNNNLSAPAPYVDPRSPKPYRPRAGVSFEELTLHVPRGNVGMQDLGRALNAYPRSPYPSAPLEATISSSQPAPRSVAVEMESPETRLNQEFWAVVTLEDSPAVQRSFNSPQLMFGKQDGSLWSPRPNKREPRSFKDSMLSPAQRNVFKKGTVASPSPNDPKAAFPSFTVALMNMESAITYPPRARVE